MMRYIGGCSFLSLCILAAPLSGQAVVPVGPEQVVTSADVFRFPAAAADSSGNFMVVWGSYDGEILGRLFDAGGDPQGPQFQINSDTIGGGNPDVTATGDGKFAVVWHSSVGVPPDVTFSLEGQSLNADGTASGSQFQVTANSLFLSSASNAATGPGEFVVVWRSYSFADGYTLRARRLTSDGLPLSAEFQVDTHPTNRQYDSHVESDADGDFVVVWESYGSFGDDNVESSIQARRFASSGAPLGDQFQVNTQIGNFQDMPSLAVAEDGTFVVAWRSSVSYTIEGQRFSADGSPRSGQFQIDDPIGGVYTRGRDPEIASGLGDSFLVVWRSPVSLGSDTDDDSIQARYFPAGGGPGEPLFQVNSYSTGDQNRPALATDRDGVFLAVWREPGLRGQFLVGPRLFADGFESGDTTAWSNTIP